jgi:glycosyltransferase involved in cell wall biosynthesis
MMHVVRVIAKLEPGGAQLGALRLTQSLRKRGIETRLLAGEATLHGASLFRGAGIELEVWGRASGLQYACSDGFAAWLRPRLAGADLVHAHMFGGWWAASEALAAGVPLAASEHNEIRWPDAPREREMRRALSRVNAFFGHGPASKAQALRLGLSTERLRDGSSAIEPPTARPRPGLPSPRLVFAGRLHHEKGPDLLIEALGSMHDPPPTYLLGAGPLAAELRRRADELGLDRTVQLVGWQSPIGPWFAGATACVVPSRHESWSQTAVTAMGYGVPVIGAAVEGLPQTLAEGRGALVPPDDPEALAAVLERALGGSLEVDPSEGRRYAAQFAADRVAAYYASTYRRLTSEGGEKRDALSAAA